MNVASVRLGFANNSSSTHSILLFSTAKAKSSNDDYCFGWEWFHLVSKEAKARYLAAILYENLPNSIPDEHKALIVNEMTGSNMTGKTDSYIDHQSRVYLPGQEYPNLEFFRDLQDYILNTPGLTIRGGNDNEEYPPDFDGEEMSFDDITMLGTKLRKDGDWWVAFNASTGAKTRLSFKDLNGKYERSTLPELVDIKITDACPFKCPYCYMGSLPDGKVGNAGFIDSILYALGEANVFEVAFGGGEPTSHPKFGNFLRNAKYKGIVPNFTSFNMDWAKDSELANTVEEYCGSFAVSHWGKSTLEQLMEWNKHHSVKGTLQLVAGSKSSHEIMSVLTVAKEMNIPVTFLGFKRVGRGGSFDVKDYSDLLKGIKKMGYARFGADTLFVKDFKEQLDEMGIPEELRVAEEGMHSCYIDAVEQKMGPCSYMPESMHAIPTTYGNPYWVDHRRLFEKYPYV